MSTLRLWVIKVFCYGVIYVLCQVIWCDSEVTWVTRNVTDSFRIGEDGCLKNKSVCTTTATCQDDGSCSCNKENPHFRNPTVLLDGTARYGTSYGCIGVTAIRFRIGEVLCQFRPYQVIPNDHKEPATQFINAFPPVESCTFISFEAKFPNNNSRTRITWINQTYFQLNYSTTKLYFLWKKSVPELKGLIITINLYCRNYNTKGYGSECLQAKVLGTWRSSVFHPRTELSTLLPSTTKWYGSSTPSKKRETTIFPWLTTKDVQSNKSLIIAIAILAFFLILVIILLLVLGFLFFKLRRKKRMLEERVNSEEMQSRNAQNDPNAANEDPSRNYATLDDHNRRENDVEHVYQGLVGSQKQGDTINPNTSNSPSLGYENPSAHEDYEELKDKRRDSAEHVYQGLVKPSERGGNT